MEEPEDHQTSKITAVMKHHQFPTVAIKSIAVVMFTVEDNKA